MTEAAPRPPHRNRSGWGSRCSDLHLAARPPRPRSCVRGPPTTWPTRVRKAGDGAAPVSMAQPLAGRLRRQRAPRWEVGPVLVMMSAHPYGEDHLPGRRRFCSRVPAPVPDAAPAVAVCVLNLDRLGGAGSWLLAAISVGCELGRRGSRSDRTSRGPPERRAGLRMVLLLCRWEHRPEHQALTAPPAISRLGFTRTVVRESVERGITIERGRVRDHRS